MAKKTISNEFMQNIVTEEAWKELSEDFNWSESLLEKYQDKLDWSLVSGNNNIRWTIPMIEKFQKKLDWDKLSETLDEDELTETMIETFKNKWNWHELSGNNSVNLTHELLEKYADQWDWEQIIGRYGRNIYDDNGIDFYERYKDYIPVSKLQGTYLWREIIGQEKKQLIETIIA